MAAAQQQVATGRRIAVASDDPLAVQQAVGEHATLGTIDAYTRTGDAAAARLSAADTVLTGFVDKLTAAIVAGTGARGTGVDPAARAAASQAVRACAVARRRHQHDVQRKLPLLRNAGQRADLRRSGGGWTYQGDASTAAGRGRARPARVHLFDGQAIAQGSDSTDVFTALDQLATAIDAGDNDGIGTGGRRARARVRPRQRGAGPSGRRRAWRRRCRGSCGGASHGVRHASLQARGRQHGRGDHQDHRRRHRVPAALGAVSSAERQSLLDYLR